MHRCIKVKLVKVVDLLYVGQCNESFMLIYNITSRLIIFSFKVVK